MRIPDNLTRPLAAAVVVALCLALTGCGDAADTGAAAADAVNAADAEPGLAAFVLESEPGGAIPVAEARNTAQPGEAITVFGRIGAADTPFGRNYATFVLGDEAILYCDEMGDDHCPTPWDACCEDPDKIATHRASVQFVADGRPVEGSMHGVGGLSELDAVVVTGEVNAASTPDNLVIDATGVFRRSALSSQP